MTHRVVLAAPVAITIVGAVLLGTPASPAAAATYPATPTVSSAQYPEATWAGAPGTPGTFTFAPTGPDIVSFSYRLDDSWVAQSVPVVRGASGSVTITPADAGVHTLYVKDHASGGPWTAETVYSFGVGSGNTDFGLMAAGITDNQDMTTADLRAKAQQLCASGAMIDTAVDGKTAPTGSVQASAFNAAVVETLTPGTDEDENLAWVDPTQWDQDYQQATGNQVPPYTDSDIKPGTVLTSSSNPVLTCVDNDTPADFQADGADYTVRSTWHEVDNALAAMRNGWYNPTTTKGWGYYKVVGKHNLTTKIVRFVTKHPYSQRYLGALSWNYTSYNVYHIKCSGWGPLRRCKSVARTQVVVGHNFTALSDRIPKGVITAYCKGYDGKCPSWVKNAINVP